MLNKTIRLILALVGWLFIAACGGVAPVEVDEPPALAQTEPTPVPLVQEAATPISPVATPTPLPNPTPTTSYEPPPICQFEPIPGQPPTPESQLDQYIFSEPQSILTYEVGINIISWLPDNKRLFITRRLADQSIQNIELFNIQTGKITQYGQGSLIGTLNGPNKPVWLDVGQEAAFVDFGPDGEYILRIGRENNKSDEVLTALASTYLAAGPNAQKVTFFNKLNPTRPQFYNPALSKTESINIIGPNPTEYDDTDYLSPYQLAWHPDKKRFVYHNNRALYLANTHDGTVCEVDWGRDGGSKRWVLSANWSPDGRYLAAFTTIDTPPVPFIDLIVTNLATGVQQTLDIEGGGDQYAMAWAPNSRDLLVIAQNPEKNDHHNLYIIDTNTGRTRQILTEYTFIFTGFSGVAWTLDGKTIALRCPSPDETNISKELCIIAVEGE